MVVNVSKKYTFDSNNFSGRRDCSDNGYSTNSNAISDSGESSDRSDNKNNIYKIHK